MIVLDASVTVELLLNSEVGRRIAERQARVRIWGVERDLRARVEVLNSFSAHADRNDLLAFARASGTSTRRVILVHGEPDQQNPLRETLQGEGFRVEVPMRGQSLQLD